MKWQHTDHYEIGVYWPYSGGYGIATVADDLEQCAAEVEKLKRGHYGEGNNTKGCPPSEIHIRRVRIDRIPLDQLPEKKEAM